MNNQDSSDIDWAAIVDLLASEYGWTIKYIVNNLDLGQIISLKAAIQKRYEHQNGGVSSDVETVPGEEGMSVSYFEKMGGKKTIREDGTIEILL